MTTQGFRATDTGCGRSFQTAVLVRSYTYERLLFSLHILLFVGGLALPWFERVNSWAVWVAEGLLLLSLYLSWRRYRSLIGCALEFVGGRWVWRDRLGRGCTVQLQEVRIWPGLLVLSFVGGRSLSLPLFRDSFDDEDAWRRLRVLSAAVGGQ